MATPSGTAPKWGEPEMTPLPKRFNSAIRQLAADRFAVIDVAWADVVFARGQELFSREDAEAIEREALDSGYRFDYSANVSLESEPDKYHVPESGAESFTAVAEDDGRQQVGVGDNVSRHDANITGTLVRVSRTEQVMTYLTVGVPEGTIALIDDAGGTLTAPILEDFAGVICLGGTVKSHLGILSREYGVPCLMNCQVDVLEDGVTVELEVTADPPGPDAYEKGETGTARIWTVRQEG